MTPSTPARTDVVERVSGRVALKSRPTPSDQVDGAWWPSSRDLAAEVDLLLPALGDRVIAVGRVVFHADDWNCPHARMQHAGTVIRLDGYRFWPSHLVKIRAVKDTDAMTMMVIPPETAADIAADILEQCSADGSVVTVDDMTALLGPSRTEPGRADDAPDGDRPQRR
ncbi:DUF5994 family protein [Williamsia serinedens]|uniref:Uncharacterized protein n=1 Tax=Williamsia serinedens TaxID=391736 RepID=A0ABT1H0I7_9NOCA|nr:DUF5994 family protein [Williamsia serinedens]MCP2160753.1 hypothetical protein [Williamsia serinedens]